MFLFRKLSTPAGVAKKAPVIQLFIVSLIAQSCTTISELSQKTDQSFAVAPTRNETTPSNDSSRKTSIESDGQKKSSNEANKHALNGTASWYGSRFHGKKTASGEIYDQNKLTAAHKTLPLGSKARVTNLDNGNTVVVEINDRGPFVKGRIIDLSRAAAGALGLVETGTAPVKVELIEY